MNTIEMTLDISKRPAPMQVVRMGRGDTGAPSLAVTVTDNGEPFDLSGYGATFEVRTPGGTVHEIEGAVNGGHVTFPLDFAMEPGATEVAYVALESETAKVSTQRVRVVVLEGRTR